MGCSGSKEQDLPLVVRCRKRRELIRAASNYRYALAAAHVTYFRSLKDVGDALRKFVDEDLIAASISSSVSSPSLILPPTSKKKKNKNAEKLQLDDSEDEDESHLYLSDSSSSSDVKEDGYLKHQHHNHYALDSDDESHQNHTHHAQEQSRKDDYFPHYPHGGFDGYNQAFGDGLINDPYLRPYTYSYPPHMFGEPYMDQRNQPGLRPPLQPWYFSSKSNVYYMNRAAPEMRTVVREPPPEPRFGYTDSYWNSPADGGGNYGYFTWGPTARMENNDGPKVRTQKEAPPPPSPPPPKASGWDFFNPFDVSDNGYPSYYSSGGFGYKSNTNSPDSNEQREREGIPDLEEDTENEVSKESLKGNRVKTDAGKNKGASFSSSVAMPAQKKRDSSFPHSRSVPLGKTQASSRSMPLGEHEGSSRSVSLGDRQGGSRLVTTSKTEGISRSVASWDSEKSSVPSNIEETAKPSKPSQSPYVEESFKSSMPTPNVGTWVNISPSNSTSFTDGQSSSEVIASKSMDDGSVKKKGVSFEVEEMSNQDADSSKLSSVTILSPHGTRDLHDVVAEIRDDFEIASSYGKEVANMLEVGKLPHHSGLLKVILSRVSCHSTHSAPSPSAQSVKLASRSIKLAKSYFEDVGKDEDKSSCNLSSTLDKLYVWERKLYKEVKDEERLRVLYEKQWKRLKYLDEGGAESSKLESAQVSISKLLTRLEVSMKAIDSISSRIHKLRDEELQPQVAALVHGLIRMWKAMLKCHQKQFQSIMDSKMRKLKANTGLKDDSSSRATIELERELRLWCERFIDWIAFQKSYIESLNGWLLQCVQYEPEETPDGPVPYSPGQLGAPPIFMICNDWHQAMESISEARVTNAMNTLVTSLRQLGEKQDEEGRQRLKAEYLSKDFEKHLRSHRMATSDKTGLPLVPSSKLDDQKVDLDSMRHRLAAGRMKHKDAKKLVNDAASSSLRGGLVPIFKALENFTSDALNLHEHVRLKHPGPE
ncbi:hypothetical protein F511_03291 [Dorcoceras hygrometricum]|uniref:DUF632 domain-containing protein n=1 Tax=Dorcoceras hygrometricum TaxID=472368 RepID=A0A2Z7BFX6_9LAMI|nr:hypothetical protein F511_03291 [Dorcoceras hygrometricum]